VVLGSFKILNAIGFQLVHIIDYERKSDNGEARMVVQLMVLELGIFRNALLLETLCS
jgi:hypothetical protein